MAMAMGDSLLLSTSGSASRVSCSSNVASVAVSTHGDQCRSVVRLAGCRTLTVVGGLPSLESRVVRLYGSSWKKLPNCAIRAAKSGSVDAPESAPSPSPSTSTESQAQSHLDLLERMTENSVTASRGDDVRTIRDQLSSQVEAEASEVVVPLATSGEKDAGPDFAELTVSQKRNIRRQNYLNKVSERNDAPFFATVAAFVLLPPILILGFAVATGYVEFFP